MRNKISLLIILHLSFLIFSSLKASAQWVTILDSAFAAKLQQLYPTCMNGNQMDTTCSNIVNATNLICNVASISNLSGIEYFDNLVYLQCSSNQLTSLPPLPHSLKELQCHYNPLTSLPALPNTLKKLICSNTLLSTLPVLPNSLIELNCQYDTLLISLPNLPDSLEKLNCSHIPLTSLPVLPSSLEYLQCAYTQLSSLPALPNSLLDLFCNNSPLSSLPALPNSLKHLKCYNAQLSSLPTLPNSLLYLLCRYNQLTSLPALPASLTELQCQNNQLTSLPALPASLEFLYCSYNQLTSLPALPNDMYLLSCPYNQLTSLPAIPSGLDELYCQFNQISSLPQLPYQMYELYINNNNMYCLTNLPYIINGTISFYVNIWSNSFTCVPNQTVYTGSLPVCYANDPVFNTNDCQGIANISGNVYTDLNSNCVLNNTDLKLQNIPVKVYDMQDNLKALSYTQNGLYSYAGILPDSFKIKIDDAILPIAMSCNQSNTKLVNLVATSQSISGNNFSVVCDSVDNEVKWVSTTGWVFPGQKHSLITNVANDVMWYNLNCGVNNYSGTVTISIIGPVTFDNVGNNALIPIVSGNTFTYNISNFDSLTPESFKLKFKTDTTANAGDQICVHVKIQTTPTDNDTTNNVYDYCYNVVNSYDPNEKEVYPAYISEGETDWLTYTIHFQNIGSAPAFNIRLRDTLDADLDYNTFEFLGASHTAKTNVVGNVLKVRFDNIMLPDSTTNYEGSMGYFQYRIKPLANLSLGQQVSNKAYIYFDYNAPIITNTVVNPVLSFIPAAQPSAFINYSNSICAGTNNILFDVANDTSVTYTWNYSGNGASIVNNGNSATFSFSNSATSGILSVTPHNMFGYGASRSLAITIINEPIASSISAMGNTNICANETITLIGNTGGTWNTGSVDTSLTINAAGNYFVTTTNTCGSTTSNTIAITVNPLPTPSTISAMGNTTFCDGGSVMLTGNIGSVWNDGSTASDTLVNTSGTYSVTSTNACGSTTSNNIVVTVQPNPVIPTISQTNNILSATIAASYQWLLNGVDIPSATQQQCTVTQNGNYSVVITDANGCSNNSASVTVIITGIENMYETSTGFKIYPNPVNDKLYIEVSASTAMTHGVKVFDVIGNEISLPYEKRQLSTTNFQFSISNLQLSSGIYFVKVGNEVKRFIRE